MMRRPMWLGAGVMIGVGATLWAEQRVRRRLRRAVEVLTPLVAGSEAIGAARAIGGRVRGALDAARAERTRHETELWHRMGEAPPVRHGHRSSSVAARPASRPRERRPFEERRGGQHR